MISSSGCRVFLKCGYQFRTYTLRHCQYSTEASALSIKLSKAWNVFTKLVPYFESEPLTFSKYALGLNIYLSKYHVHFWEGGCLVQDWARECWSRGKSQQSSVCFSTMTLHAEKGSTKPIDEWAKYSLPFHLTWRPCHKNCVWNAL